MNIFSFILFLFLITFQVKDIESTEDTQKHPFTLYMKQKISPKLWKMMIDRMDVLKNYTETNYPDAFEVPKNWGY